MHVFIDTNILLSFYHFTNEDLDVLSSVLVSSEKGAVNAYLTDQVRDEFNRNRESKLRDALRTFRTYNLAEQLPFFMKAYEEYSALRALVRKFKQNSKTVLEKVDADIRNRNLRADHLIDNFFNKYPVIETSDEIYREAVRRVDIGNPPGKRGSIGDAINWLLLLESVPNGQDLFLVADDEDFRSTLFPDEVNEFLVREWTSKKGSKLHYYRSLTEFFKEHFDGVHVSFDQEKQSLIAALETCGSFAATHAVVAKLETFKSYSFQEAKSILEAANSNSQVGAIRGDKDVAALLRVALVPHQDKLAAFDSNGYLKEILASHDLDDEEAF